MTTTPVIDYTDKDFASLRDAMLRLARQRLPEWTDQSPADLGMLLVDLFAYCGDILAYYQDRIASELFPGTATERASVVDLLRLIGYELQPITPAAADLQLTFDPPADGQPLTVVIENGSRFISRSPSAPTPVEFTYLGPSLTLNLASDEVRPDFETAAGSDKLVKVLRYDRLPVEQSVIGQSSPATLSPAVD